jgi:hypothetical protein
MDGEKPQTQLDTIEKAIVAFTESTTKRFDQMDERFEHMDERFGQIDERFKHVDEVVDTLARSVKQGFDDIRSEMATKVELNQLSGEMTQGFEGVNGRLDGINRRIDNEAEQRVELGLRVEKVEAKVFPELQRQ